MTDFENYNKYISHHMDLSVIYERLAQRKYIAPEEFVSDLSWIVHNMLIYPGKCNIWSRFDLFSDKHNSVPKDIKTN